MEGNTSKQLSEDLAIILSNSKDKQASKVSVVGCGSSQCDKGNNILQNIVCMSIRIKRFVNNFNTEAKWVSYLSIKWYYFYI
jgi:hypothetical protein